MRIMVTSWVVPPLLMLAACGAASAQTITWGSPVPSNTDWATPKMAGDGVWDLLAVGQDGPLQYETNSGANEIQNYATGSAPSVAMTLVGLEYLDYGNGIAVEVHQSQKHDDPFLCSEVAHYASPISPTLSWLTSFCYDHGYYPSVAMEPFVNSSPITVVEVHQASAGVSKLWYHVGSYNGGSSVDWGPSYAFDNGKLPSVSVCQGTAIEVHQGDHGTLWYSMGVVSGNTIKWTVSQQYDKGYSPSITMCGYGNTTGPYVVEVHQAENPGTGGTTPLYYHLGLYNSSGVVWYPSAYEYAVGCSPTVAPDSYYSNFLYGETIPYQVYSDYSVACGNAEQFSVLGTPNIP